MTVVNWVVVRGYSRVSAEIEEELQSRLVRDQRP